MCQYASLTQKPKIRDKPQIPQIHRWLKRRRLAVTAARINPEQKSR
jgi:hypothetical protein